MDYVREAENILRGYNDIVDSVENLKKELSEINAEITCLKNFNYSGMPQGGGSSLPDDILVNKLFRKQKATEELKITIHKLGRINDILSKLSEGNGNEEHEKILRAFYIKNLKAENLEKEMECSERHAYRLKNTAIRRFAVQYFGIKVHGE